MRRRAVGRPAAALLGLCALAPAARAVVDPLALRERWTLHGGVAVAATCVEHATPPGPSRRGGTLVLAGVPPGATVVRALLYWTVLSPDTPVDTGTPTLDGVPLVVEPVAEVAATPCFSDGQSHSAAFRADVTALVAGDGTHVLDGLPGHGDRTGTFTEGASLFVAWCGAAGNEVDVVLFDGLGVNNDADRTISQVIDGFAASAAGPVVATLALAAGNGQSSSDRPEDFDPLLFEGVDLDRLEPRLLSGDACPGDGTMNHGLYDRTVVDVSGLLPPGAATAALSLAGTGGDCHSLAAALLVVATDPALVQVEPSAVDLRPGATPLTVRRRAGRLELAWEDVGLPVNVHRGRIGDWYSHGATGGACAVAGSGVELPAETGDHYFVAASAGCGGAESSAGRDSLGTERPRAADASGDPCP